MTKEYVGSVETKYGLRHNLTKYILSNDIEIVLSDEEIEELLNSSKLRGDIEILKAENMKLAHQKDYYKSLIRDFSNILTEMKGV